MYNITYLHTTYFHKKTSGSEGDLISIKLCFLPLDITNGLKSNLEMLSNRGDRRPRLEHADSFSLLADHQPLSFLGGTFTR